MKRKDRELSESEKKSWLSAVKDVKQINSSKRVLAKSSDPKKISAQAAFVQKKEQFMSYDNVEKSDGSSIKSFHLSKKESRTFDVEATLDLHGMTQESAFRVLQDFLMRNFLNEKRNVCVITGKGKGGEIGTLRREFPKWLSSDPLSRIVVGFKNAHDKDGGTGSYYVVLKKLK